MRYHREITLYISYPENVITSVRIKCMPGWDLLWIYRVWIWSGFCPLVVQIFQSHIQLWGLRGAAHSKGLDTVCAYIMFITITAKTGKVMWPSSRSYDKLWQLAEWRLSPQTCTSDHIKRLWEPNLAERCAGKSTYTSTTDYRSKKYYCECYCFQSCKFKDLLCYVWIFQFKL